jgi:hypothetical protein
MNNYKVKRYENWLVEDKTKVVKKGGESKLVYKKIDDNSFLIKYIRQPIINTDTKRLIGETKIVNGQVKADSNNAWKQTLKFLDDENVVMRDFPEVKDPNNIIVYSVVRGLLTPNRIVITYNIYEKSKFQDIIKDAAVLTLYSEDAAKYAVDDQVAAEIKKRALNIDSEAEKKVAAEKQTEGEGSSSKGEPLITDASKRAVTISSQIPVSDLKYVSKKGTNANLFKVIDNALTVIGKAARNKTGTQKDVSDNPIFKEAENELDRGAIGENVVKVISAIMRAYNITTTDKRGNDKDMFSQEIADKLSQIAGMINEKKGFVLAPNGLLIFESRLYEDGEGLTLDTVFGDVAAVGRFVAALKPAASTTTLPAELKDIKYPIKFGTISNEVKAVQKLMVDKLTNTKLKSLSDKDFYKKFMKFKDDGEYGGGTRDTVAFLKSGLKRDFKLSETDGNTITKEFVDALSSYNEK